MLFTEPIFLFAFLPTVLVLHRIGLRVGLRFSLVVLLACSLVFYAWWSPKHILVLLVSVFFNHRLGNRLRRTASKRELGLGITANLVALGFFKYTNFLFATLGLPLVDIVLPIGISFFTFQQIAWLVSCRVDEAPKAQLLEYVLFVTFFPHFIAGPIVSHNVLLPQLLARPVPTRQDVERGAALFCVGLFKKVALADSFATLANPVYDAAGPVDAATAWLAAGAYSLQLYLDFSGYSDMAIGLAKLFGFTLPINFDAPYQATSASDFWRRWHITLSEFLRDHLYIPLGGNRHGRARTFLNLMITMGLGGLWHGAGWTFVTWGLLHGSYLVIGQLWGQLRRPMPTPLALVLTQLAVLIAWVPFRATTFSRAGDVLWGLTGVNGLGEPTVGLLLVALGYAACQALPVGWRWAEKTSERPLMAGVLTGAAAAAVLAASGRLSPFLYFQF